jgi:hypothetical protein
MFVSLWIPNYGYSLHLGISFMFQERERERERVLRGGAYHHIHISIFRLSWIHAQAVGLILLGLFSWVANNNSPMSLHIVAAVFRLSHQFYSCFAWRTALNITQLLWVWFGLHDFECLNEFLKYFLITILWQILMNLDMWSVCYASTGIHIFFHFWGY